ncbi:hypothetical protein [Streptomyces sp. NPDC001914]|uniref:hypothetical protein n=1 Tax=Streptomyces sp. NPDC001914 TaxID=3364623 RepID=UPI0036848684
MKIVEFRGGTISVDPEYRDCTRITFTFAAEPSKSSAPSAMPEAVRPDTEGGR